MTMAGLSTQAPARPPVRVQRLPGRAVNGVPASRQARWLVGWCVAASLLAAVWLSKAGSAGVVVYTLYAAVTVWPLFARDRRAFEKFCRLGALIFLVGALAGFPLQLYLFLPSAVLLLVASHVGSGHGRRRRALVAGGTLFAVLLAGGWLAAIYHTALRPADAYLVIFHSDDAARAAQRAVGTNAAAIGAGATGITFGAHQWKVRFGAGLSASDKAQLQERLRAISDGAVVRLCSRWNREC